jgi:predicted RNA-binding protein with PUA-like domain
MVDKRAKRAVKKSTSSPAKLQAAAAGRPPAKTAAPKNPGRRFWLLTGLAEVSRAGYPDGFAFRKGHKYSDPESDPAKPTWYMVDIRFVERFPGIVSLAQLKENPGLAKMKVVQKGSRLSVQPVTAEEFAIVTKLGRKSTV